MEPMLAFLGELLLEPLLRDGVFLPEIVESEKKNLIATIESERNDKRVYAASQLLRLMCKADSFGIPRLGEKEDVAAVTPAQLWSYYKKILEESPIELFYVGSAPAEEVIPLLQTVFAPLKRNCIALPPQTPFQASPPQDICEIMDVAQGKLSMGFVTPTTLRDPEFAATQVLNVLFGGID